MRTTSVENIVFWDVMPCSRLDLYRRFRGTCQFYFRVEQQVFRGGSRFLRNVGDFLPDFTTSCPMIQYSSYLRLFLQCFSLSRSYFCHIKLFNVVKAAHDHYGCRFYAIPPTFFFQAYSQYAKPHLQLAKTTLEVHLRSIRSNNPKHSVLRTVAQKPNCLPNAF
jgi:hypothetical protein